MTALVGSALFLLVLTVYVATMAPTLSFWDCGEFIAVSHILGIPHPPGTPLYVLIGRLFALNPLIAELSARINFLSALGNAVAALFGYLAAVRLLRGWGLGRASRTESLILHLSSVIGACMLAFGITQWSNSIEAEVYALSMAIAMGILWIGLKYLEAPAGSESDRLFLVAIFLAVLGVGIHLTTFLIVPAVAVLFAVRKGARSSSAAIIGGLIVAEMILVIVCASQPGELPLLLPYTLTAPFVLGYLFALPNASRVILLAAGGLAGLAAVPLLQSTELPGIVTIAAGAIGLIVLMLAAFHWMQELKHGTSPDSDRLPMLVVLVAFLFSLLCGVMIAFQLHGIEVFLGATVLCCAMTGWVVRKQLDWMILLSLATVATVAVGVMPFVVTSLATVVLLVIVGERLFPGRWRVAAAAVLLGVIGFSVHLFIPIRSAEQPSINQNDPSRSLQATIDFIERKQYGSESMLSRMFERRAEWTHQFGEYPRMGFLRALREQFSSLHPGASVQPLALLPLTPLWYALLALLVLFGIWEVGRRSGPAGVMVILFLLVSSVGLVLYMNFADGTRIDPQTGEDYLEVRDRDYFFTPAFLVLGLMVGIGVASLCLTLRELLASQRRLASGVAVACVMFATLIPAATVAANWFQCDRSNNYIPYDFAKNLLDSCEPESVLFTYGDNDTFPLWCLQETYRYRTDVRVVNLSLGNTDWYVRQVQTTMGLPLGMSDDQIDALRPYRDADGTVYRVQDQLIDAIVRNNTAGRPVQFSTTVSSGGRRMFGRQIDSLLQLRGLVLLVQDSASGMSVDLERTEQLLTGADGFSYRGLSDLSVFKDDATSSTVGNVVNAFIMLADTLRSAGKTSDAETVLRFSMERIPFAEEPAEYLGMLFATQNRREELAQLVADPRYASVERLPISLARLEWQDGEQQGAIERLQAYLEAYPGRRGVLDELMRMHILQRNAAGMIRDLQRWVEQHPDDQEIANALLQLRADTSIIHRIGR